MEEGPSVSDAPASGGQKRVAEEQITKESYDPDHLKEEKNGAWKPIDGDQAEARRIVTAQRKEGTSDQTSKLSFAASVPGASIEPVLPSFSPSSPSTSTSPLGSFFSSSSPKLDFSSTPSLFGTLSSLSSSSGESKSFAIDLGTAPLFGSSSSLDSTIKPLSHNFSSSLFGTNSSSSSSSLPSKFTLSIPSAQESSLSSSPIFGVNIAAPLKLETGTFASPPLSAPAPAKESVKKVDVKTGEEEEERIFSVRAKLLELDATLAMPTWKERGVGQVHINQSKASCRIVMRAEGILKLILNALIFPSMSCERVQDKGVRISPIGENGKPTLYLLRVSRKEEAIQLLGAIERCKESLASQGFEGSDKTRSVAAEREEQPQPNEGTNGEVGSDDGTPQAEDKPDEAEVETRDTDGSEPSAAATPTPVAKLILSELDKFEKEK